MCAHECVSALVATLGMFCSSCLSELFMLSRWLLSEQFFPIGRYPDCLPAHRFTVLSLTVLSAYTSSSSLFSMSLLINPNCSWYHNLSLLKWFGDQGLAVSSFQLITVMCCWFHRAIKAVWLPLDFICENKVVSLPQRRGGNEIESRIFWSYSQRKSLIPGVLAFSLSPIFISHCVHCKTQDTFIYLIY